MRQCGRLPIPERLLRDDDGDSFDNERVYCDSLMISAYDSEAGKEWATYKLEIDAPNASLCSREDFDLYSESSSYKNLNDIDIEDNFQKIFNQLENLKDNKCFPERSYVCGLPLYPVKNNTLEFIITNSRKIIDQEFYQ